MPRTLRARAQLIQASEPAPAMSTRPRRAAASSQQRQRDSPQPQATITVARDPSSSPADGRSSIRLTVKMPPSKLREATSGNRPKPVMQTSRDSLEGAEMLTGPRSSRGKRSMVIDSGSEDEEDDVDQDEDAEGDDDDAEGEEDEEDEGVEDDEGDEDMEDEEEEQDEEDDAEGEEDEEEDAEGESDAEMQDAEAPPPPIIQRTGPLSKPRLIVTPAPTKGPVKSVEAKQMQMANVAASDEDLSDLPEDDAEGEDVAEDDAMVDGDEDAEGDSDDDLSRDGTPDLTKLTKRQRGRIGDGSNEHFMSLNMGMHSTCFLYKCLNTLVMLC